MPAVERNMSLFCSSAVQAAIAGLPAYNLASAILRIVPRLLADFGYAIFSKNRKRIFGTQNICNVVKPADRELFLD